MTFATTLFQNKITFWGTRIRTSIHEFLRYTIQCPTPPERTIVTGSLTFMSWGTVLHMTSSRIPLAGARHMALPHHRGCGELGFSAHPGGLVSAIHLHILPKSIPPLTNEEASSGVWTDLPEVTPQGTGKDRTTLLASLHFFHSFIHQTHSSLSFEKSSYFRKFHFPWRNFGLVIGMVSVEQLITWPNGARSHQGHRDTWD